MPTETIETEVIHRIHFDQQYLEVGDWTEVPGYVELRTVGESNVKYFGPLNLALSAQAAKALGEALIACAKHNGAV